MKKGKYPNVLLVDCFIKHKNKYLLIKRKKSERWFPGWYGSIWREVPKNQNPCQVLKKIFKEFRIKPKQVKLKAIANNVFHNLKQTFNVFLFIVEVGRKPKIEKVPEGEKFLWLSTQEFKKTKILAEYKKAFQKIRKEKILFYHTEYDFDKMLKMKFYCFY